MQIEFAVQTWREGNQYVAHAMPLDVASAGESPAGARAALDEAVRLFLRSAAEHGTLADVLEEAGYAADGTAWRSPAWVGIERAFAEVPVFIIRNNLKTAGLSRDDYFRLLEQVR